MFFQLYSVSSNMYNESMLQIIKDARSLHRTIQKNTNNRIAVYYSHIMHYSHVSLFIGTEETDDTRHRLSQTTAIIEFIL